MKRLEKDVSGNMLIFMFLCPISFCLIVFLIASHLSVNLPENIKESCLSIAVLAGLFVLMLGAMLLEIIKYLKRIERLLKKRSRRKK